MKIRYKYIGCYLSKKQQIKVLKNTTVIPNGLCSAFRGSLHKLYGIETSSGKLTDFFPHFTKSNIEYYGKGDTSRAFYWQE